VPGLLVLALPKPRQGVTHGIDGRADRLGLGLYEVDVFGVAQRLLEEGFVDGLSSALASAKEIAARYGASLRTELNPADEKDERVIDELFEEELDNRTRDDEAFQQVVDAVMDEIEERFAPAFLPDGKHQKTKVGWPLTWTWETGDRDAFIASISRFASNYAPLFGTLLTPLVNGVRVSGCPGVRPVLPGMAERQAEARPARRRRPRSHAALDVHDLDHALEAPFAA
jgi:hypothetical protein